MPKAAAGRQTDKQAAVFVGVALIVRSESDFSWLGIVLLSTLLLVLTQILGRFMLLPLWLGISFSLILALAYASNGLSVCACRGEVPNCQLSFVFFDKKLVDGRRFKVNAKVRERCV